MAELKWRKIPWRIIGWGGAVVLLAVPFLAMRITSEVNWSAADFAVAAALFAIVGAVFELAVRASPYWSYRGAAGLALAGALLIFWANLAVGIVGSEDNPSNQWFFGALAVGFAIAGIARFRPRGMAAAAAVTALSLEIAFGIAVSSPTDEPFVGHTVELAGTSVFAALFLFSAVLFRKAALQSSSSS